MNRFLNNEKMILNITRYGAVISTLIFAIIITIILIIDQKTILKNDIKNIEESFIFQNKMRVENLVSNISNYIEASKKFEKESLNKRLKEQVYQAHAIATAIYNKTSKDPNYTKDEILQLIKESIRNVRFNDNLGYMFMYTLDGKNILNAQFPEVEGQNHWNYKDSRGVFITQEMNKILSQKDETYYEWYWKKNQGDDREYKKFGFFKKFEPLGIFIGTGDYVDEYEKDLKEKILFKINSFKFVNPTHIFIYSIDGTALVSPKKEIIGTNRMDEKNEKDEYVLKPIFKFLNENKQGFIEYNSTIKLNDRLTSNEKISYVKLIEDWGWVIGSGFYTEEINNKIKERKKEREETTSNTIIEIIIIISVVIIVLLIAYFYLSKIISTMFNNYRLKIESEMKNSFEKEKLLIQQSKMATMGEMLSNIAHQWKQPLNMISLSSGVIKINQEVEDFSSPEDINRAIDNIDNSVKYLSTTIDDFRNFFRPDKEKSFFYIEEAISRTTKLVSSQFKNNEIEIIEEIDKVEVHGFKNEFCQVLINLLKNAKDELIKLDENSKRLVFIKAYEESKNIVIDIKDSAGGVPAEIMDKIFEPYFTTKKDSEGTGIGLYMSKQIIEGMEGHIEVMNEEFEYEGKSYKGALFRVIIPL